MRHALALVVLVACSAAARADVILLADGTRVDAKFVAADASDVRFQRKGGQPESAPRKDVAAVLFFDAAKSGAPASTITDRVEMDSLVLDGTLVRVTREKFGPFGLTRAAFIDANGALVAVATPRRIASIAFGTWKAPAPPPPTKPAKGAKPAKPAKPAPVPKAAGPAEELAAAEKALAAATADSDVPALLFAADAVLAAQTDDAVKTKLAAEIETTRGLLAEHEKRRVSVADVRVEAVDFSLPQLPKGLPPGVNIPPSGGLSDSDPDAGKTGGPGVYAYFRLATPTGELLGPTVRVYWRSKDGHAGFEENAYFTKTSARVHGLAVGMSWYGHEIERIAVQVRVGDKAIDTKEAVVGAAARSDKPWWNDVKENDWPKHFVTHRDSSRDEGRVTDTYWARRMGEVEGVDDDE